MGGVLALAATGSDRDVPHGAPGGPVPLAVPAEVPRLVDVVVVVVAELGVEASAPRTREDLLRLLHTFGRRLRGVLRRRRVFLIGGNWFMDLAGTCGGLVLVLRLWFL